MAVKSATATSSIKKVAVLGAGVMGQGIAAHLANAGVPSILFDIVPRTLVAGSPRSKLAIDGIANASKLKPAAFYRADDAALISPANFWASATSSSRWSSRTWRSNTACSS